MIITCESCKTKFRLDPSRLRSPMSKVRCSKCGHKFFVANPEEESDLVHVDLSDEEQSPIDNLIAAPSVPEPPASPRAKKQISLRTPLILFALVILIAGGAFWFSKSRSSLSTSTVEGNTAKVETQQPAITILDTTQAYFLENAQGGQIFVVEGEIVNESIKAVSFVLLEGKLYTKNNHVAQAQKCFSGNLISRDELTKLSMSDIQNRMMNREGKNLMNVHIATSKRIPFLIVFHNLPEVDALSDYSVEVVNAQFD